MSNGQKRRRPKTTGSTYEAGRDQAVRDAFNPRPNMSAAEKLRAKTVLAESFRIDKTKTKQFREANKAVVRGQRKRRLKKERP